MIRVILFDVDGVLVNEEKKWFSYFLEEEIGISRELTYPFLHDEFLECVEGKKDLKEVLPKYLKEWKWDVSVDEALRYWHTKEHIINEPLVAEMESYKAQGIKVYTATNQEMYRTKYIREDMGFGKIFEEVISSSMLGHRKPDRLYYEKILSRIGSKPDITLFWDDSEENIAAARAIGMHAEQYEHFSHFKEVMEEKYHL